MIEQYSLRPNKFFAYDTSTFESCVVDLLGVEGRDEDLEAGLAVLVADLAGVRRAELDGFLLAELADDLAGVLAGVLDGVLES